MTVQNKGSVDCSVNDQCKSDRIFNYKWSVVSNYNRYVYDSGYGRSGLFNSRREGLNNHILPQPYFKISFLNIVELLILEPPITWLENDSLLVVTGKHLLFSLI